MISQTVVQNQLLVKMVLVTIVANAAIYSTSKMGLLSAKSQIFIIHPIIFKI
jgi:hypothetical protein